MPAVHETVEQVRRIDVDQYKYGFETDIESEKAPKGLSEDTVRFISEKKSEPAWMLEWRLEAYRRWLTMDEPTWAKVEYVRSTTRTFTTTRRRRRSPPRSRSTRSTPKSSAPMRSSAFRCASVKFWRAFSDPTAMAAPRRGRCGVRLRFRGDHLQGGAEEGRRDLHADLGGLARAPGPRAAVSRLGRAGVGQFLRHA